MIARVVGAGARAGIGPVAVAGRCAEIAVALAGSGAAVIVDAAGPSVRLRPHVRGARHARPRRAPRRGDQRAGRLSDHLAVGDRRRARTRSKTRRSRSARLPARSCDEHERSNPNVVKVVGTPVAPGPAPRALFHARDRALGGGAALPPHRRLRLSPRGAGAFRRPAAERA